VKLHVDCLNADGRGTQCVFFKFWSWQGPHPTIGCDYKQEEEQKETAKGKEEIEEEQEEEGEREWREPQFIDEE
jgi:hypothetical protein